MKNIKVLIVEDDHFFTQLIYFQLTSNNYSSSHVQHARSIMEVEEFSKFFIPDVILLDLNIVDSNGKETFERTFKIFPKSAIIILSGMDDQGMALEIVKQGAQDFILKSDLNNKVLLKTIEYSFERKDLLDRIQKSEKQFRDVFEQSPLPMFSVEGPNLVIKLVNNAAKEIYGFEKRLLIGRELQSLNFEKGKTIKIDVNQPSFTRHLIQKTASDLQIHVEIIGNKLSNKKDSYICLIIDRSDEIAFEEQKYKVINEAQESEKKKIAMELHDGLAQNLVLMSLWFNMFNFSDEQKELGTNFSDMINSSIKELKAVSYSLLPPELEKGFLLALENLVHRVNHLNKVLFKLTVEDDIVEDDFALTDKFNLYRIIQEFVNNSLKHAQAQEMEIIISRQNEQVVVLVKDNGIGFNKNDAKKGLGIQNLEHRIKLGKLLGELDSKQGEGTELKLIMNQVKNN